MKTLSRTIIALILLVCGAALFLLIAPEYSDAAASLRDQLFKTVALSNGTRIDEFSTDGTLAGDSDLAVPTEKAVKTYADGLSGSVDTEADTFIDGDLDGSDNLVVTRGAPGDKYPISVMLYDENDVPHAANFTPSSTTVTTIHMADEVADDGGTLASTWTLRIIYDF